MTDKICRFYQLNLSAINLAAEPGSNFTEKIGTENRPIPPILSFICHRLKTDDKIICYITSAIGLLNEFSKFKAKNY